MVLFSKRHGIITIKMSEKDAQTLAGIIHTANPEQMLAGYGEKEMAVHLYELLTDKSVEKTEILISK